MDFLVVVICFAQIVTPISVQLCVALKKSTYTNLFKVEVKSAQRVSVLNSGLVEVFVGAKLYYVINQQKQSSVRRIAGTYGHHRLTCKFAFQVAV